MRFENPRRFRMRFCVFVYEFVIEMKRRVLNAVVDGPVRRVDDLCRVRTCFLPIENFFFVGAEKVHARVAAEKSARQAETTAAIVKIKRVLRIEKNLPRNRHNRIIRQRHARISGNMHAVRDIARQRLRRHVFKPIILRHDLEIRHQTDHHVLLRRRRVVFEHRDDVHSARSKLLRAFFEVLDEIRLVEHVLPHA